MNQGGCREEVTDKILTARSGEERAGARFR